MEKKIEKIVFTFLLKQLVETLFNSDSKPTPTQSKSNIKDIINYTNRKIERLL